MVQDPKLREIFAPSFRDRLVHHFIVDRLIPLMDRKLIFDSYANRPQKGVNAAVSILNHLMLQLPPTAYFMKLDIASYFTSINRLKLKELLRWHLTTLRDMDPGERLLLMDLISEILDQNPADQPHYSGDSSLENRHQTRSLCHLK